MLRLLTGAWADQGQNRWRLTFIGYGMTAVCVPLLAITPFLGAAGLATATVLILLERTGKAVRSPAKSALLADMATQTGRGKGFGVHKALDQVGAFSGPLLLAGMAALTGVLWPGFALLAIPGALSLLLLAQVRRHSPPLPGESDTTVPAKGALAGLRAAIGTELPGAFHIFSLATAFMTAGLMTFGVISFRLVDRDLVTAAVVPLVYAAAMAVEAVGALVTGQLFDRWGGGVLLAVPALVAGVPLLVFADTLWVVFAGIAVWGIATAIQDSTVKAYVADLVPQARRATAYGVFGAVQGLGALGGGALAGALVEHHLGVLAISVAAMQVVAATLVGWTLVRARRRTAA
jgi:MFS family permease